MAARYKVSTIAGSPQRMGEAVAALTSLHFQTTITEVIEVAASIPITTNGKSTQPGGGTGTIKRARPKMTRTAGGAKASETSRGKIIMRVLATKRVARYGDLQKAIEDAGFTALGSILVQLTSEGRVIREGKGVYRLPSTTETLHEQQVKDPTFSATGA